MKGIRAYFDRIAAIGDGQGWLRGYCVGVGNLEGIL
jgi:hypothetical protein